MSASPQHQQCGRGPFINFLGESYDPSRDPGLRSPHRLHRQHGHGDGHHGVDSMEFLITLVLIGLVVMLFPYILAAFMAVAAMFVAVIAAFVFLVKRLFNR